MVLNKCLTYEDIFPWQVTYDPWPSGDGTVRFSMTRSGIRVWEGGGGHIMSLISDWLPERTAGLWLVLKDRTVTTRDVDSWSRVSIYTMSRSETILPLMTRSSSPMLSSVTNQKTYCYQSVNKAFGVYISSFSNNIYYRTVKFQS